MGIEPYEVEAGDKDLFQQLSGKDFDPDEYIGCEDTRFKAIKPDKVDKMNYMGLELMVGFSDDVAVFLMHTQGDVVARGTIIDLKKKFAVPSIEATSDTSMHHVKTALGHYSAAKLYSCLMLPQEGPPDGT
ncbi:MAG: hypothetical protein KJ709_09185 [Nanoarchaeota archaeon]|nr:hypothetical protein [Nanoarchaeota archaeon]